MKKLSFLIAFFIAISFSNQTFGQNPGVIPNDSLYEKLELLPILLRDIESLPPKYDGLLKYCHTPTHQGRLPSCVAHAVANAISIAYAVKCDLVVSEDPLFSASFLYNQIAKNVLGEKHQDHDETEGCAWLEIISGLEYAETFGVCPLTTFDNSLSSCKYIPSLSAIDEAASFKIKNYWKIFELCDSTKLDVIRYFISINAPVLVGINLTPSYWDIKNPSPSKYWEPSPDETAPETMLHAMVVVAYDEDSFTLMDSRGPNWGNNGFISIKNEDFDRLVRYGFKVQLYQKAILKCAED